MGMTACVVSWDRVILHLRNDKTMLEGSRGEICFPLNGNAEVGEGISRDAVQEGALGEPVKKTLPSGVFLAYSEKSFGNRIISDICHFPGHIPEPVETERRPGASDK